MAKRIVAVTITTVEERDAEMKPISKTVTTVQNFHIDEGENMFKFPGVE